MSSILKKHFVFLCFTAIAAECLVLLLGFYPFREHFLSLERDSFFAFDPDFLSGFLPWNTLSEKYPKTVSGPGPASLLSSFLFQFYRSWGAVVVPTLTGLSFTGISLLARKKIRKIGKRNNRTLSDILFFFLTCLLTAIIWIWLNISPKFPIWFSSALLLGGALSLIPLSIEKKGGRLFCAGLVGLAMVWISGFAVATLFWLIYLCFEISKLSGKRRISTGEICGLFLFSCLITLEPRYIAKIQNMPTAEIYRSGFAKKWYAAGFANHSSLYNRVKKTERLVLEGDYTKALETADEYWFTHPCPIHDLITGENTFYRQLSKQEIALRQWLAAYTKIALIGSQKLNEAFFSYYRIPEIYDRLYDEGLPFYNMADLLRNQLIGNTVGAYSTAMNLLEIQGLSYILLEKSVEPALACQQYGLADKYIALLEKSLFHRQTARQYSMARHCLATAEIRTGQTPSTASYPGNNALTDKILADRNRGLTSTMNRTGDPITEARILWQQNPVSSENLEYISLVDLLYKQLDSVIARIPVYIELSGQTQTPYRIPDSWQEMLYIRMEENPDLFDKPGSESGTFPISPEKGVNRIKSGGIPQNLFPLIENIDWNEKILKQYRAFVQARKNWQKGTLNSEELTRKFGHTFAYNYYFSRFIVPFSHRPESLPLAH